MCSGKSTLGKLLSKKLSWEFLDVDMEVEKSEGMPIMEIFEKKGEDYFRSLELETLKTLAKKEKVIISTGGGLGANKEAMEFMKKKGLVVWLIIDFEDFLQRCGKDPSRPLLKKGREELLRLFEERSEVYGSAHILLDSHLNPKALAEQLLAKLNSQPYNERPGG
ncbi:MAG: shikimate kinase [Aquificaceae bacterium]|nr:shikimate kinase [Aquificaceae bacterium]